MTAAVVRNVEIVSEAPGRVVIRCRPCAREFERPTREAARLAWEDHRTSRRHRVNAYRLHGRRLD